jgi:hypothetical protein
MPDIILIMHAQYGSSDRLSGYSSICTEHAVTGDPGAHHIEGIFVASGPGIQASREPLPGLLIEDVAPTILHTLGLPVPEDMDGRVIVEMFQPGSANARPVLKSAPVGSWPDEESGVSQSGFTASEEATIEERLRALGYIE